MIANSLSDLIDAGYVPFRFSLDEDIWIGKYKDCGYKIYLHKWRVIPYRPVDLFGYQIRCVFPRDLIAAGVVGLQEGDGHFTNLKVITRSDIMAKSKQIEQMYPKMKQVKKSSAEKAGQVSKGKNMDKMVPKRGK